jgi:hypothetical protein
MSRSWKSLKGDLAFGLYNEEKIKPLLEKYFGLPLTKEPHRYAHHDYFSDDRQKIIELKSRRNTYNKYETTLLNSSKIRNIPSDTTAEYYFVFNYTDGMYFIKYDKEQFNTFKCEDFTRIHRADKDEHPVKHYYIPIEALTRINSE